MRAAFRERSIIINTILIPIFLYPFLLWATLSGMMFVMGQSETLRSRIVVKSWPIGHPSLRHKIETSQQLEVIPYRESDSGLNNELKRGTLDLVVEFVPAEGPASALAKNFEVRLASNDSKERSVDARNRITDIVSAYRTTWLKREAGRLGINDSAWQGFTISTRNLASKKEMGAFVFGMLAPVIFIVMVAMGCFYPAVDAIAGERERNTWETLMSCAASRLSVVTAKYLYVVTFGGLAGLLNLLAVIATIRPIFAPLVARTGHTVEANIPLAAIPVAVVTAVLLAGFVGAGMMIFASFARTFKEGQAMVTPFYMLILIPVVFLQAPGLTFSWPLAFIPIVNITMMVRETFSGHFNPAAMLVTTLVSLAVIALCLRLAAYILQFEDLVVGSYSGSLPKFLRQRLSRSRAV